MRFRGGFAITLLVLVCCAVYVTPGCMEISDIQDDVSNIILPSTPTPVVTPQPTPTSGTYAEGIVVPVSPYATAISTVDSQITTQTTATPSAEYYAIYQYDGALNYNVLAFDTIEPVKTLRFDYILYPEMYTISKGRVSNFADKDSFVETLTRANPNAFFTISVFDSDSGLLVESKSHPTIIANPLRESFRIYSGGNFHVEITGAFVDANVTVCAPFIPGVVNMTSATLC